VFQVKFADTPLGALQSGSIPYNDDRFKEGSG
jgi:hypothetical protein